MDEVQIATYARELFDQYGAKAMAIAAQRARSAEETGNESDAKTWRRVEAVLTTMRGAPES
jgi:hypothetical protein